MNTIPAWWQDRQWYLAFLAAVIYWFFLYQIVQPLPNLAWPFSYPIAFLVPCLIYPVLEETVFRGLIQGEIKARLPQCQFSLLSCANIFTSILFTALHFMYHPPLWALAVFIPSLIFGYFKDRSTNLLAPILLHVFYNSGYFLIFTHNLKVS